MRGKRERQGRRPSGLSGSAASLATLLFFFGSCATDAGDGPLEVTPGPQDGISRELSRTQFEDVPVPRGFKIRTARNESFSFRHGNVREGRLVYGGAGFLDDVEAFYRSQMTLAPFGWTEGTTSRDPGRIVMSWRKDAEICEITLVEARPNVIITVDVTGT